MPEQWVSIVSIHSSVSTLCKCVFTKKSATLLWVDSFPFLWFAFHFFQGTSLKIFTLLWPIKLLFKSSHSPAVGCLIDVWPIWHQLESKWRTQWLWFNFMQSQPQCTSTSICRINFGVWSNYHTGRSDEIQCFGWWLSCWTNPQTEK